MIIVNFSDGCTSAQNTYGLWKYDYGQKLRIQGLNLPAAVEVHFSLSDTSGESVNRIGVTRDGVTDVPIPDSFLENENTSRNYHLYAFIYLTDETSGQTEYKITMMVHARPKPEVFDTPEDAELFRDAIAAVNGAAGRAEEAENNAKESEGKTAGYLAASYTLAEQVAADKKTVTDLAGEVEENRNTVEQLASATVANAERVAADKVTVERLAERVKSDSEAVGKDKAEVKELTSEVKTHANEVASNAKQVEEHASAVAADKAQVEENAESVSSNAETVKKHTEDVEANTEKVEKLAEDVSSNAKKVADDREVVDDIVKNAVQKVTPYIGENGNWFVDGKDTGKPSGGVSSWNDLTDKPFYENDIVLFSEQTVTDSSTANHVLDSEYEIVDGMELEVSVNGNKYLCNVSVISSGELTWIMVGDKNLVDCPVLIHFRTSISTGLQSSFWFGAVSDELGEEFTLGIKHTELKKLDKKYTHNSWNDVTDKPFYEKKEIKIVTILPEATYEYIGGDDDCAYIDTDFTIEKGKTYTVLIGGEKIECVAQPHTAVSKSGETFETLALPINNVNGSSLIWFPKESRYLADNHVAMIQLVGYDYTLSILGETEVTTVVYLDPKFIKDMYYTEDGGAGLTVEGGWEDNGQDYDEDGVIGDDEHEWTFYFTAPIGLVVGNTYTVSWNGTDYTCVGQDALALSGGEMPGVFLGNMTGESSEPFVILEIPSEYAAAMESYGAAIGYENIPDIPFAILNGNGSETIHKIDNKYLDLDWLPKNQIKKIVTIYDETVKMDGLFDNYAEPLFEIIPDETHSVTFDGTKYECIGIKESVTFETGVYPTYYLGNKYLTDDTKSNTGEPFLFFYITDGTNYVQPQLWVSGEYESAEFTLVVEVPKYVPNELPENLFPSSLEHIVLRSSTAGSTKLFKLTVDDSGTISATEVTE